LSTKERTINLAIVTGANRGIGNSIATRLSIDGYKILAIDQIFSSKSFDYQIEGDVSDASMIKHALIEVENLNPSRLVLVNCAGITIPGNADYYDEDSWELTLRINLTAPYLWLEKFSPQFISTGNGTVINIASLASQFSFPNNPAYDASKAGIVALTRSYAQKFGSVGVTCNSIAPGYIETSMTQYSNGDPETRKRRINRTLLKRLGNVADVSNVASFLASEDSSYITGQLFFVDGGYSVQGY